MKRNLYVVRNVILWGILSITFGWAANSFAHAQCPVDNRMVKMPASDGKYYLPENYVFKVKFEGPISTDNYKNGSIVQFSAVENVYGVKMPEFETENEVRIFRNKLDDIIRLYKSEINYLINSHTSEFNGINYKKLYDNERIVKIEQLNIRTTKKLEELYARKNTAIEYTFFRAAQSLTKSEIEEKFRLEASMIEDNFNLEIRAVNQSDLSEEKKSEEIEKIEKNKFEKLEQLDIEKAKQFEEDKARQIEILAKKIDEDFKTKVSEIEKKFQSDAKVIEASAPNKTDTVEKLELFGKLEKEKNEKIEKLEKEKKEKIGKLKKMPEVVVVIPKTTKGFGKVERAKRGLPLFINLKARISVVLDYVLLDNGDCIPIEIRETPDVRLYYGKYTELGNVIDCKSLGLIGKKCIKGRRPQYNVVSPIISGLATVAGVLLDNPTAQALAGITAVEQLTKGDLGNVINGGDATISDKLIYEVATRNSSIGTFKKEEKK